VKKVSDKVVRSILLSYLSVQKLFMGNVRYYMKIWPKLTHFIQKRPIFNE